MPDMKSTGRAILRISSIALIAALGLSGCKTLKAFEHKTAAADVEVPETVPQQQLAQTSTLPRPPAVKGTQSAYIDPTMRVAPGTETAEAAAQPLPGTEQPAAQTLADVVTQPTGINAGRNSIFSAPATASAPTTDPTITDSPASAYISAPGVNARNYSVYGSGQTPSAPAPLPQP